ncbi:NADH-quinone oxidoreductase subunit M [Actinoalloteichus hoggarensis]|uniref:NADH-quinone oxidoreductase subunit M n=2 Tax=Actinoalloteichus hoggarensis TaxID=1470176 RepID=A0A221VXF6_9PSEU|nr:NADH-quinone oxidoreductase subunit M [Actinoalloteichus hoggarensis]MBB5921534.1 NADH-quinone oxidoreductase subunit M [Actinoalloteichus hoggarensis]
MSGPMVLLALLILPLVGALVVAFLRRNERTAKLTALAFSLVELVLAVLAWTAFDPSGPRLQLTSSVDWIPAFGVHFSLGVDGIALVMIALIAVLVPIVIGASWEDRLPEGRTAAGYFSLLLVMQSLMVGVFAATDVLLFYVFFEAVLVPMYFIIGRFGGPRRQYAAVKFFLYSLLGGLIMLASVIGVYVVSTEELGQGTFDWETLAATISDAPLSTQIWLFLGFFIAFAIKAPLVPLHTWLPDAGAEAPVGAGVLLVGVLDKIGTFGFLRYCLPLFPLASQELAPLILVLAVAGVLYGSLLAVGQSDMKRFVAYTSVAHFGFIALGIFAFSTQAQSGAVLYMVNHGISTGMLFLVVGMVIARGGSRLIQDYGGLAKLTPVLAGLFLVAGLSSLALPGTNSFVSEFLVLIGSFPREPVFTVLAAIGMILAALYVLWVYQRVMQGPLRGDALTGLAGGPGAAIDPNSESLLTKLKSKVPDLSAREIGVLAPLVVLIVVLGFYPAPVLEVITPSVEATMTEVGLSDPVTGAESTVGPATGGPEATGQEGD